VRRETRNPRPAEYIAQAEFDVNSWGQGHGSKLSPSRAEVLNGGIESVHIGTIRTESQAIAVIQQFIEKGNEQ
jgi:hypothetical protein